MRGRVPPAQGRRVAVLEPAHLSTRRDRKAEARHDRRALQPAARRRRRDHVAGRIDDIEMYGVAPFDRQGREGRFAAAGPDRLFLARHREHAAMRSRASPMSPGRSSIEARAPISLRRCLRIGRRQQGRERHVDRIGVAIKDLAVGKAELQCFDQRVDQFRPDRVQRGDVDALEQAQRLQQHRALRPRPELVHREPVIVDRQRRLDARRVAREIIAIEQSAMPRAGRSPSIRRDRIRQSSLRRSPCRRRCAPPRSGAPGRRRPPRLR